MTKLPFTAAEYQDRLTRLQRAMAQQHMDAIVVTTPPNFRYFTGLDSQFWESPARPWFLVLPAAGDSIAVVPGIAEVSMRQCAVGQIETWASPNPQDEGVSVLAAVLRRLETRHHRIGFELGRESVVRMPVVDFLRLRESVGATQIVDGSPCIWQVRYLKSPAEVDLIRTSAQLVSRAFESAAGFLHPGVTQAQACRELGIEILRNGADTIPYMACASGVGGYDQIIARGTERAIEPGEVLIIDVGATVAGYFCDFDRNYAVGAIDDAAKRAHDAVWHATEVGIATARPGVTFRELWRAMMDVLEQAGMRGNNAGRIGHGLGLQLTEPPSVSANDDAVIQEGMVLAIEPGMEYAPGRMIVHEENVVVTSAGAELLTVRAPREMWTLT